MELTRGLQYELPRACMGRNHYGLTPTEDPEELSDLVPALHYIRDVYLVIRERGGRMFIDPDGAFYKDEQNRQFQFVKFKLDL